MWPVLTTLLLAAGPDCGALYRAAAPSEHASVEEVVCATWSGRTVLAAPLRRPNAPASLEVVVMKAQTVEARLVDDGAAESYSVYGTPKLKLDLAAFKGPDGSPAFGVRVENRLTASSVTDGESSTLNLYALSHGGLKRVLKRLLALEAVRGSVCNGCDCSESKRTRTLAYDAKHRLTVRTTRVGWAEEKKGSTCVRTDVREKPGSERLDVHDGEFVVPESMRAE